MSQNYRKTAIGIAATALGPQDPQHTHLSSNYIDSLYESAIGHFTMILEYGAEIEELTKAAITIHSKRESINERHKAVVELLQRCQRYILEKMTNNTTVTFRWI